MGRELHLGFSQQRQQTSGTNESFVHVPTTSPQAGQPGVDSGPLPGPGTARCEVKQPHHPGKSASTTLSGADHQQAVRVPVAISQRTAHGSLWSPWFHEQGPN